MIFVMLDLTQGMHSTRVTLNTSIKEVDIEVNGENAWIDVSVRERPTILCNDTAISKVPGESHVPNEGTTILSADRSFEKQRCGSRELVFRYLYWRHYLHTAQDICNERESR